MQVPVYNQDGKQIKTLTLNAKIFGVTVKSSIVHEAVVAQRANAREVHAHTKRRGEVRGGGKKPWKQKGTGRARHGSIRSPIWRGGGVVFGPRRDRVFAKKINRKVRRAAILMTLSDKVASGALYVLTSLQPVSTKTKEMATILKRLPMKSSKTLLALPHAQRNLSKITRNVRHVTPIAARSLNVVDVLNHGNLVTTEDGIKEIETTWSR